MTDIPDSAGGPAFPTPCFVNAKGDTLPSVPPGMSLRDYFAAKAMQAMLPTATTDHLAGLLASSSYIIADQMLAEREQPRA